MGSNPVAVTSPSDFAPASSKEFLDIQATIECGFTLKRVRDMIKTYNVILTLKKGVFSILFKQSSMKSFHIAGPLIEILCLVLVSFNLGFEKFKVDDLVENR